MPAVKEKRLSTSILPNKDLGRLPKYGVSIFPKQEKIDEMYPLQWQDYDHNDVEKGIDKVLGPLSLFAPFPHEDVPEENPMQLERPVTPINDEIKKQPKSFEQMTQYVRRRITPRSDVPFLTEEDQKCLAAVIMGEVNGIWPDIRKQIDDPFLTGEENKELNRRIIVCIVSVCSDLFHQYLEKASVLNKRGVFSGPANMSRLRAQLALETSDALNILKIRRYIVSDIKAIRENDDDSEDETKAKSIKSFRRRPGTSTTISRHSILDTGTSRLHQKPKRQTTEKAIKEIEDKMPVLNTSCLMNLVADLPDREFLESDDEFESDREDLVKITETIREKKQEDESYRVKFQRSKSEPVVIVTGETLFDELGLNQDDLVDKLIQHEVNLLQRQRNKIQQTGPVRSTKASPGTPEFVSRDLQKLTEVKDDELPETEDMEELPPLIQAITRHARHDDEKERMEKLMKELDEKQKQREEEESIFVKEPKYPQPDTVKAPFGKQGVVQTSDIRVSERVCMSSITINKYPPVYNDLTEEIDQVTVKNLDKNMFLSGEINEVYDEVMESLPTTHLELDDLSYKDPLILDSPETLNAANTLASATLSNKLGERVINPDFLSERGPPWGQVDMKQWVRTPANPPKNFRGEDIFSPNTPNMEKINAAIHNPGRMTEMLSARDSLPNVANDNMSRTYASWLQWWRSTMTSDDYMKYLSTMETDFLGAIYHFYDSEDNSDTEEEVPKRWRNLPKKKSSTNKSKGKTSRASELQEMKSEYKEGFWNINSVLIGGLGKEPDLKSEIDTPKANETTESKVITQKAARQKRELYSRLSKAVAAAEQAEAEAKEKEEALKNTPTQQDRLEGVWQKLCVPDSQRLDMAVKYSSNQFFNSLEEIIEHWEMTAELVLEREMLLTKLEAFERHASDPNRFFNKETKKSSHRLKESRQRANLYKMIDELDADIKEEIEFLKENFQDSVTYKGRPYTDKIRWDRTEMLYWLAEERKQHGIQYEVLTKGLNFPLNQTMLQPLET